MKWVSKRVRVITSRAPESGEDETDNDCEVDTLALVHPYRDGINFLVMMTVKPLLDTLMASYYTAIGKTASAACGCLKKSLARCHDTQAELRGVAPLMCKSCICCPNS
jgi:hypothetical protein